jgi:hypothetical protein
MCCAVCSCVASLVFVLHGHVRWEAHAGGVGVRLLLHSMQSRMFQEAAVQHLDDQFVYCNVHQVFCCLVCVTEV